MVCEKCSHFIHMNSKNWHFVTWYLCEKLLMCQYMLFLSWKSVLLTSKSFMNAVLFKWPKFLLRSYLTKTCAISAYFMIRARFGGGWGWVLVPFIWVLKEYQMFCCSYLRCLILEINSGSYWLGSIWTIHLNSSTIFLIGKLHRSVKLFLFKNLKKNYIIGHALWHVGF